MKKEEAIKFVQENTVEIGNDLDTFILQKHVFERIFICQHEYFLSGSYMRLSVTFLTRQHCYYRVKCTFFPHEFG